jgi:hypothetical protein
LVAFDEDEGVAVEGEGVAVEDELAGLSWSW